jgi:hypothetical protein
MCTFVVLVANSDVTMTVNIAVTATETAGSNG